VPPAIVEHSFADFGIDLHAVFNPHTVKVKTSGPGFAIDGITAKVPGDGNEQQEVQNGNHGEYRVGPTEDLT